MNKHKGVTKTGLLKDFLNYRKYKYQPLAFKGEFQASGSLENSDIIGAIANCIATNIAKLTPQLIRKKDSDQVDRNDYLSKILTLRWSPEYTPFDALYKMASDLVYKSNAFAVIFYEEDFSRVKSIVPITTKSHRIFEYNGNIFFKFTWEYDGNEYVVPYQSVIHLKARLDKKRFLGTPPDQQVKNTLELLDCTGESLRNAVKNSAGLRGYLKYNNLSDEEELQAKVKEFQAAYMQASNEGGLAGLDTTMEFVPLDQKPVNIPTLQSQFLRENLYRYYNVNDHILMSQFTEAEWNAFYESVIEPIAIQLSLEFTYKILTERQRGFGNTIIFTANRLQYATLQTRLQIARDGFDRGAITINEYREFIYLGPIEDGDVRMVSLNYVKADEQSIYQIGQDNAAQTNKGG